MSKPQETSIKIRHIYFYENCSANVFSQFFDRRDVTQFLADYKGAEASQRPSHKLGHVR